MILLKIKKRFYNVFICCLLIFIVMCNNNSNPVNSEIVPQPFIGNDTTVYIFDTLNLNASFLNNVKPEKVSWYKIDRNGLDYKEKKLYTK